MSDPTNENAGATPPENPPAGESPQARRRRRRRGGSRADAAEAQTAAMAVGRAERQPVAAAEAPTAGLRGRAGRRSARAAAPGLVPAALGASSPAPSPPR